MAISESIKDNIYVFNNPKISIQVKYNNLSNVMYEKCIQLIHEYNNDIDLNIYITTSKSENILKECNIKINDGIYNTYYITKHIDNMTSIINADILATQFKSARETEELIKAYSYINEINFKHLYDEFEIHLVNCEMERISSIQSTLNTYIEQMKYNKSNIKRIYLPTEGENDVIFYNGTINTYKELVN